MNARGRRHSRRPRIEPTRFNSETDVTSYQGFHHMATKTTELTTVCSTCQTALAHLNKLINEIINNRELGLTAEGKPIDYPQLYCTECKGTRLVLTDAGREFFATVKPLLGDLSKMSDPDLVKVLKGETSPATPTATATAKKEAKK